MHFRTMVNAIHHTHFRSGKAYCIMKESGIEKAMNASAGTIAGRDSARNGQMLHGAMNKKKIVSLS